MLAQLDPLPYHKDRGISISQGFLIWCIRSIGVHVGFKNECKVCEVFVLFCLYGFEMESHSLTQAGVQSRQSRLTTISASRVQAIHSPALASRVAVTTGLHYHTQLIFVLLVETGFYHVSKDGLDLLTS